MLPTLPEQRSHNVSAEAKACDQDLIQRIQGGDEGAFQEFIDLYAVWLKQLVIRLLAYDSDSEDVLQMILVTVWQKAGTFRGDSSLKTWLYKIATRHCRNHQRAVSRWWRRIEKLWEHQNEDAHAEILDERWEQIQHAMTSLKHADREILVLVFFEGYSVRELSKLLDEKLNTLEVRLHRAKERLRNILKKADESP